MKAYIVEKEAVAHNIDRLKAHAGGVPIWAVLKGDGYGLGAGAMAALCRENGLDRFAVTEPREARAIREAAGEEVQILMLRATTDREELGQLMDLDVILTLSSREDVAILEELAGERERPCRAHLKIDTGMGRYGFLPEEQGEVETLLRGLERVRITGVYTHFHSSFGKAEITRRQFDQFRRMCDGLEAAGLSPGERHCCNSSAFLRFPDMHLDGVRLGSAILGRVAVRDPLGLKKVGWAEASVEELRVLPKGHTVGYGAATTLKRETRSAVIGIGYCHGFTLQRGRDVWRAQDCIRGMLSNLKLLLRPSAPTVTVGGRSTRTLGHIGMLHTCVDVTDLTCQVGDRVRVEINPLMVKNLPVEYR